jgi:hypothetical protein
MQRLVELWERRQPARTGAVEHGTWGIYGTESRYQATAGEDTADWEDLMRAVVICKACTLLTVLCIM